MIYNSAPLTIESFYEQQLERNIAKYGPESGAVRTQQDMADLEDTFAKSLITSGNTPVDGATGGDAIKDVTLAPKLAITERRMETEAPLWTELKKVPHPFDRVEFGTLDSFGGDDFGGSINTSMADGGLQPQNPDFGRVVTPMGWFGGLAMNNMLLNTQRTIGVSGTAIGNSEDTLGYASMSSLVLNLDRAALHGDRDKNVFQPNGLLKQTRAQHTAGRPTRINCKGLPLSRDLANHIEAIMREKGATWKRAWMTGYTRADFATQYIDAVRVSEGQYLTAGLTIEDHIIKKWNGAEGKAAFKTNNHLRARQLPFAASPFAPIAPVTVALTQSANAAGNALDAGNLPAGPRSYIVVARGINGRALGYNAGSINVTSGNKVNVAITVNDISVVQYEVYAAANTSGAGAGYVNSISAIAPGNALAVNGTVLNFTDDYEFQPGCDTGFFMANGALEDGMDEVQIMQQFPVSKIALARQFVAMPFGYAAAMTPIDFTPAYNLILENMGRTTL